MGGRGSFLKEGGFIKRLYQVDGFIEGIKILIPKDPKAKRSLPERAGTPNTSYVSYHKDGTFRQFITFDEDRMPRYRIDYSTHRRVKSLHVHYYKDGDKFGYPENIYPKDTLYQRHKRLFIGVPVPNERN